MRTLRTPLLPFVLLLPLAACGAPAPAAGDLAQTRVAVATVATAPPMSAGALQAHVTWLAADERKGRDTGSPELLQAAAYIAGAFAAAGLAPGGDDGTFLQDIGWAGYPVTGEPRVALVGSGGDETPLQHGADWTWSRGAPLLQAFPVRRVASAEDVQRLADEVPAPPAGALAAGDDEVVPLAVFVDSGRPRDDWSLSEAVERQVRPALLLRAGRLEAGEARAFPERLLGHAGRAARLTLHGPALAALRAGEVESVRVEIAGGPPIPAPNVVAVLPGSGTSERPELADEVIVLSAHYDHDGVLPEDDDPAAHRHQARGGRAPAATGEAGGGSGGQPVDRIFNGADDDASGVAALLELARAFGRGAPPARTLVFLAASGEEKGLLGTFHYLEQPARPLGQTVANVNFEMIGVPDERAGGPGRLWLTGFERTNLGPAWQALGLPLVPDPRPEQHFFQRSDNYAFAVRGIVAQTLSSGGDPHPHYHTVDDEPDLMDWQHMEAAVRACHAALLPLAGGELDPEWLEGGRP